MPGLDRCAASWEAGPTDRGGARPGVLGGDEPDGVAAAVVASARLREESRGAHWRDDFEDRREAWRGHLLVEHDDQQGLRHHFRASPADELGWALGPSMIHTTLAEIEGLVRAAGLDLDALSLIISEALDEDLGGRGVLPDRRRARRYVLCHDSGRPYRTRRFRRTEPGTVAGLPVAAYTVASVCAPAGDFELTLHATDGDRVARDAY